MRYISLYKSSPVHFSSLMISTLSIDSEIVATTDKKENLMENLIVEKFMILLNKGAANHYCIQTNPFPTTGLLLWSGDAIVYFKHKTDNFFFYLNAVEYLFQCGPPKDH